MNDVFVTESPRKILVGIYKLYNQFNYHKLSKIFRNASRHASWKLYSDSQKYSEIILYVSGIFLK